VQVAELSMQLEETRTRLMLQEDRNQQQDSELGVLKRALGLRSELPTGLSGQAKLLTALAQVDSRAARSALPQHVMHGC
jgi:hypothetical protein